MSQQAKQLKESQVTLPEQYSSAAKDGSVEVMNCPSCDYSSTNKHYLRQHIDLVHTAERPFKCPFCDYAGKRSHSLKEHLIVHSDERPYICTQCNAKFRKKGHLTNHYRMHSEAQTLAKCSLCESATFASRDELYNHLRDSHKDKRDSAVFCCNRCNYATTVKGNLHVHEMAHTDYRHVVLMKPKLPPSANVILKCSDCGFETNQRKELEKHMISKHFENAVSREPNRQQQMRMDVIVNGQTTNSSTSKVVIGLTPKYKCTECGHISSDEKQLRDHALYHKQSFLRTEEIISMRPTDIPGVKAITHAYICSICNYFCDTQRTLKAHMWKHSGHKNLQYPIFQNGPLSVYDDTPLAAKNFVNTAPGSQQSSAASSASAKKVHVVVRTKGSDKEVESNNEASVTKRSKLVQNETSDEPSPRVIVQKLRQASDMDTAFNERSFSSVEYHLASDEERVTSKTEKSDKMNTDNVADVVNRIDVAGVSSDPLTVMTAVCEAAERRPVMQESLDKPRVDPDTEQTAATLLSLLRQGPNINPACPPEGYVYGSPGQHDAEDMDKKQDSDSSVVSDVAGEEIVQSEMDVISCDSGQASDNPSVGKPKSGICSSLLAVIEQLRERQTEDTSNTASGKPAGKGKRKRKRNASPSKSAEAVDVVPSDFDDEEPRDSSAPVVGIVYRCRPCHYRTPSSEEMRQHMLQHEGNGEVDVLPSDFVSTQDADAPISTSDGIVYRCKLCHYRSTAHLMKQHMKMHKNKQPHECSLCDFVADGSSSLQDHMIQHCKLRQFQCKECSAVFNYKSQLRAHTRVHEDGQAFYCERCEYITSYIDCFQDHLSLHPEAITAFTCIACREAFSDLKMLQRHMKDSCDEVKKLHKATSYSATKVLPTQKIMDPVLRTLKCDQCEFVALSVRSLKSHLKRHINDKRYIQQPLEQYKCNMCGYVCHHMPSLKSHMWRHANDTDFSYNFCDLLNANGTPLDKKGKPLITLRCCQCGFETLQKNELDKHMKSHWDIIKKTFDVGNI